MRILVDLTSLDDNFSGIERYASSITKELIKSSNDNEYYLIFKNKIHSIFEEFVSQKNVKMKIIHGKNKLIFNQLILPIFLYKNHADVYLFLAFPAPFLFFSKKSISAIHDMGCWDCPETNKKMIATYFRILYRKAVRCNKKIITVSEFSKSRILDVLKAKEENVYVIYDGVSECFTNFVYNEEESKRIKRELNLPKEYILCLSTIEPRKNMRLLIDAFDELTTKQDNSLELVVVGRKGWLVDKLLEGIAEEVKRHIHFAGFVGDLELPYVYKSAEFFVFPSKYEGFGIPPLEAMACGTPVISSRTTSMPEVLGEAALFFESENVEDLTKRIQQMLKMDEKERGKWREKGMKQCVRYSWNEQAMKLEKIIKSEE